MAKNPFLSLTLFFAQRKVFIRLCYPAVREFFDFYRCESCISKHEWSATTF